MNALPCWTRIGGIADGLLASDRGDPGDRSDWGAPQPGRASLEECLLAAWDGPFGWLVLADPLAPAEITDYAAQVAGKQRLAAAVADRDPEKAVQARRLDQRHTELRQALSAGLWQVHVLAGAATPETAARVAGLFCASADLAGLPYTLAPSFSATDPIRELLSAPPGAPAPARTDSTAAFPFPGSTLLLASLARVPEVEVPGVRLTLRPEFDVTPEPPPEGSPLSLRLGTVLDRSGVPAGNLSVPGASLNRHVFVCGATGAGKSQTVRALLEAASGTGLPWLVVEPGQGRIPADGRAADWVGRRGGAHPPGRCGPGRRGNQSPCAGRRLRRPAFSPADPRRPGPGAVPGLVRRRRAVPAGAVGSGHPGVRRGRLGPGAG